MAKYSPMYWISRRPAPIEVVSGETRGTASYGIGDADHWMQVLKVQDMAYELGDPTVAQGLHSPDMLMVYLPKEKILFNADLYSPPAQGAAAAGAERGEQDADDEHPEAEARRRAARRGAQRPRRHA